MAWGLHGGVAGGGEAVGLVVFVFGVAIPKAALLFFDEKEISPLLALPA